MTHPLAKPAALVAILAACGATSACGSLGRSMGMNAQAPDEFRVVTRAPLELPPDYSLRPPRPGEPRPQEAAPTEAARSALFGQDVGQNASEGERALVGAAGATTTDPNIRQQVDFEGGNVVYRSEEFSDRVIQQGQPGAPELTEEQRTAQQESIRRATGDGQVTIERGSTNTRLPGT
ncbi:MAG: DUF3035 domain-containing protein [Hyphomonadaceae bacterium]